MRSLLIAALLCVVLAGCGTPGPTRAPSLVAPSTATPEPTTSPGATSSAAPVATGVATIAPTMAPFDAPYPEAGWTVVASVDATGDIVRVSSSGRAQADALIDLAFTCAQPASISIRAGDASASSTGEVGAIETTTCRPGEISRATLPSAAAAMPIQLEATTVPEVPFWVKLAVPSDQALP